MNERKRTVFFGVENQLEIIVQIALLWDYKFVSNSEDDYILFKFMSKTSSQLITAFVETRQNMELDADKHRFMEFQETIKSRGQKVKEKLGGAKEEQSFNQAIQLAEKFKMMEDHKISLKEFESKYGTNAKAGLSDQDAARRLEKDGPNKLSEKKGIHWSILLARELVTPFSLLLWGGAALCFAAFGIGKDPSNMYLGVIICVIIMITGFISFWQTLKSQALMDSFKDFIPPQTIVIRNGVQKVLEADQLVVGDLVRIQLGKKIPADLRIVNSVDMKVDNSSLTGETELLERIPECTNDNPLETKNVAFFSTLNREGTGRGLVFATGDRTFIGQIANLAASAGQQEQLTPLQAEIRRFIVRLTFFSLFIGGLLFGLGFAIGYPVILNFIFAIGVITANVPEGLIVEITIGLTLTAKRLADKKVLVKFLDAVETLGATSCICSDKTGTLTMNKMTAANIWYSGKLCKAENRQKRGPHFIYEYDTNEPGFRSFQEVAVVGSVANFDRTLPAEKKTAIRKREDLTEEQQEEQIKKLEIEWQEKIKTMLYLQMPTTGDASESGLIKFFQPLGDIMDIREQFPVARGEKDKEVRFPFNSTFKFAYSVNQYRRPDSEYCVFLKGAPEKIWARCTYVDMGGQPVPITPEWKEKFINVNKGFGARGERVLGFAKIHLPKDKFPRGYSFNVNIEKENLLSLDLTFVGVLSLSDPPRDSVPFAVLKCRSAGVKVIMVTGDQPATAASIARLCNIITEDTVNQISERTGRTKEECFPQSNAIVVHGDDLTQMAIEDEGLPEADQGKKLEKWLSKGQIVFARTTPAQKLIIVKACQKIGEIVAVTGDGVNDSPAIKKADIGVSMGITGTDVAKDAADMILLNDDFSSIVTGIEEGRKIYDNIKKSICYALTSQVGQMLPFIAFIIFQIPSPVTTVGVLYISIGTDLIPAIAMAYELGELDLMTRKPRSREDHMVTMTLMSQAYGFMGWIQFWGGMMAYFVVFHDFGFPPTSLMNIANEKYIEANLGDTYNPTHPTFGNSYAYTFLGTGACPNPDTDPKYTMVDWVYLASATSDLRMTLLTCKVTGGVVAFTQTITNYGECLVQQISPFTNLPVCYTTEAAKYAQTAYLVGIVICQIVNGFACKTRKQTSISQGASNTFFHFAVTTEILLVIILAYFLPLSTAFGFRDCIYMHFGIPAIPFAILLLLVDETRKFLIRTLPSDENGKPHWFSRAALW